MPSTLLTTPGFVLHTTPYGESSVVARVFTRRLGVKPYIIKGVRTAKGRAKQNLLQPLSCVDMTVYDNPRRELGFVKELSPRQPLPMPSPEGNALRMFMTEVLYKALREANPQPDLWDYVAQQVAEADGTARTQADQPLRFLLSVAEYMGIAPRDNYAPARPYFDLQEGHFLPAATESTLSLPLSATLHRYLATPSTQPPSELPPHKFRRDLMDSLLAYLQLHLSGFGQMASPDILHTLLK